MRRRIAQLTKLVGLMSCLTGGTLLEAQEQIFYDGFDFPTTADNYNVFNQDEISTIFWGFGTVDISHPVQRNADGGGYTRLTCYRNDVAVDLATTAAAGNNTDLVVVADDMPFISWATIRDGLEFGYTLSDGRELYLQLQAKPAQCAYNLILDGVSLHEGMTQNDFTPFGMILNRNADGTGEYSVEAGVGLKKHYLTFRVTPTHVEFELDLNKDDDPGPVVVGPSIPHGLDLSNETSAVPFFGFVRRYGPESSTDVKTLIIDEFFAEGVAADEEPILVTSPLSITTNSGKRPIRPSLAGINNNLSQYANPWTAPTRISGLVNLAPGNVRYPGGTVSTYWDTAGGSLFKSGPVVDAQNGVVLNQNNVLGWVTNFSNNPQPNSVEDLALAHAAHPFDPVFVMNMATPGWDYYSQSWGRVVDGTPLSDDWWAMMDDRLARNMSMLDDAIAAGLPVKYIEFGNEYFFGVGAEDYVQGLPGNGSFGAFPDLGTSYAAAVNDWSARLKERYPGVTVCAIASEGKDGSADRRNDWNDNVVSLIDKDLVDAISIHQYTPSGFNNPSEVQDETHLGPWFDHWRDDWEYHRTNYNVPENWEIWFTEYNLSISDNLTGTWANGLFLSWIQYYWLFNEETGLFCPHQFNSGLTTGGTTPALTSAGAAYKLWTHAANGANTISMLDLPEAPGLPGSAAVGEDPVPGVIGMEFSGTVDGSRRLLLINMLGTNWELDKALVAGGNFSQYTSDLGQAVAPTLEFGTVDEGNYETKMVLKAFSVTLIEIPGTAPAANESFPTATFIDNGEYSSPWFGEFYGAFYPWIYHDVHGWMYALGSEDSALYLYSDLMQGTLATNASIYPFMYNTQTSNWLYYLPTPHMPDSIYLYDYSLQDWSVINK